MTMAALEERLLDGNKALDMYKQIFARWKEKYGYLHVTEVDNSINRNFLDPFETKE